MQLQFDSEDTKYNSSAGSCSPAQGPWLLSDLHLHSCLGRWRENSFREWKFHSSPLRAVLALPVLESTGKEFASSWDEIGAAAALPMSCTLLTPLLLLPSLRNPDYSWICFSPRTSRSWYRWLHSPAPTWRTAVQPGSSAEDLPDFPRNLMEGWSCGCEPRWALIHRVIAQPVPGAAVVPGLCCPDRSAAGPGRGQRAGPGAAPLWDPSGSCP